MEVEINSRVSLIMLMTVTVKVMLYIAARMTSTLQNIRFEHDILADTYRTLLNVELLKNFQHLLPEIRFDGILSFFNIKRPKSAIFRPMQDSQPKKNAILCMHDSQQCHSYSNAILISSHP